MRLTYSIEFNLIPDGGSTVVQLTIKSDFTVPTESADKTAEAVVVAVSKQLTGLPEETIIDAIHQSLWLGDGERPEEPKP